jgi:uncharacterized protein (TIGR03067 family)
LNFGLDSRYVHELLDDPSQSLSEDEIAALLWIDESQLIGKEIFQARGVVQQTELVMVTLPNNKRRGPAKVYEVKLRGGVTYFLDMMSVEFDPFLVIQDPAGKPLAMDDAGPADALLTFIPPSDGTYKILAASSLGAGGFLLTVREVHLAPVPPVDGNISALDREGFKHAGAVEPADPMVLVRADLLGMKRLVLRTKMFQVRLAAGATYRLHMASPAMDSFLVLHDNAGKQLAVDDDSGGGVKGLDAQFDFTAPADGTYKVFAAALRGTGKFTLTVRRDDNLKVEADRTRQEAQRRLQGAWKMIQAERGGVKTNIVDPNALRLVFAGNRVTMTSTTRGTQVGTFTIDASKNPPLLLLNLNLGGANEILAGIFAFEGDALRLAFQTVRFQNPGATIITMKQQN